MKYLVIGLTACVLMLLGYILWDRETRARKNLEELAYYKDKAFKTDTVYTETRYSETVHELEKERAKQDTMPPKQTIIYQPEIPAGYIDFQNKVLAYMDSTKGTRTEIRTAYITQFPTADKLIAGKFHQDSINLTVLGINGQIRQDKFPVNYSKFNYDYYDNSMHVSENRTRNALSKQNKSLFTYNGTNIDYKHDLLQGNHQIELNSGFNIWKIRVGGYAQYPLRSNSFTPSKLEGGVKAGIRLF